MTTNRTALVLGATGGIGGEVARQLIARGWSVHATQRDPDKLPPSARESGLVWHRGDAMSAADVAAAARGVSVIVHAVNPPGYRNWGKLVLPMLDNTIAAACSNGRRIVLPGTVYNFGPDAFPDLRETSPQNPVTSKGRIRADMEERLQAATTRGASVLIVRAGDFFGPKASNNWFSQGLVKPGKPVRTITYPGKRGVGHQWAYLPDVAQTMVRLLESPMLSKNLRCSIWRDIGGMRTARGWSMPSGGLPIIRKLRPVRCRGRSSVCFRRSFRCFASCWKCAISGTYPFA